MTEHRPTGITIIAILMIIGGLVLLFTRITPLFLGPLISIDSNSSTSALGLLITIGGLVLVGLGIASLIVSWGSFKGKRMGSYNYTHNKHNFNNICYYFSYEQ